MSGSFYYTTTLPYVNADPHVGFALEIVQADVIVRYKRLLGYEVFFNTGTDEHGLKIYRKALEEKQDTQSYVDEYAHKFDCLREKLNLSYNNFIRTTDVHHKSAAQEFWKRCRANGDIYKKSYAIQYCVGCELEKTDSELEGGHCPVHPNLELERIEEENYFFRFSKYQKPLLDLYSSQSDFVQPDFRFNEIKKFVERGLEDFSISRLKNKMPWGVAVPDDDEHVMYVWFDALVNYVSAIGWPDNMELFKKWWPVIQFAGKDNLRQQSAMWQAMLLSAGLSPSHQIIIHGFITSGGQKMSKSLGNVINPFDIVEEYGTDALRYYLIRHIHSFEDSDFTLEKFKESYNGNLANGLGNLVSRVMKLSETYLETPVLVLEVEFDKGYSDALEAFAINNATDIVWRKVGDVDTFIQYSEPWKIVKIDLEKAKGDIRKCVVELWAIAHHLEPLLPQTAQKIKNAIKTNKTPEPLFLRK